MSSGYCLTLTSCASATVLWFWNPTHETCQHHPSQLLQSTAQCPYHYMWCTHQSVVLLPSQYHHDKSSSIILNFQPESPNGFLYHHQASKFPYVFYTQVSGTMIKPCNGVSRSKIVLVLPQILIYIFIKEKISIIFLWHCAKLLLVSQLITSYSPYPSPTFTCASTSSAW